MRLYEIVYIFEPELTEEAVTEKLERAHEVAKGQTGEVVAVDHWGSRQLAYAVEGHKVGYYVVAHVRADPDSLPELERLLKLDQQVLRYLIVVNEGEPTTGLSVVSERPVASKGRDDDDDDEDEDDDPDGDEDSEGDGSGPVEFSGGKGRRRRIDGPTIELLNYKDVGTLSRFMTEQGKILPKRTTKVPASFQRGLGRAIKRARFLALIPYVRDHEA